MEYEARAVALARSPAELVSLKEKVVRRCQESPLFDTERFTRNIERAYEGMWARYLDGKPPATFSV
jgi:predicted O-linked N-acetylglucosamine transferase (SPINDLY family)